MARPSYKELDDSLLSDISEREAKIADAATRRAYDRAGDWLTQKQTKSEQFPGGDLADAKGRAAAYQNAAVEMYCWAAGHGH